MDRKLILKPSSLFLVAVAGAVLTVGVMAKDYLRPDVEGRPTAELRREAIELWTHHADSPLPLCILVAGRQAHICDELTRRMPSELARLNASEQQDGETMEAATDGPSPALAAIREPSSR